MPGGSRVSVIIPTYNGAKFVADAIESVLAQTAQPDETIIVDDASSDDTVEIVSEKNSMGGKRLQIIQLRKNSGGPAVPINVGVGAATGDLVAILDQDDRFASEKIARQARVLELHHDVSMVAGAYIVEGGQRRDRLFPRTLQEILKSGKAYDGYTILEGATALRHLIDEMFVGGYPGFMFPRRLWEEKGGVQEGWRVASDYEFACWLCTKGRVAIVPEVVYVRREHGANLCRQREVVHREATRVRAKYLAWLWQCAREEATACKEWPKLAGMAYWLREMGHPLDAARCLLLQRRATGQRNARILEILKYSLIGLYRARKPRFPPLFAGHDAEAE